MDGAGLEGAAQAVDAVVGLLGREALQRQDDVLGLLGDQVVGSVFFPVPLAIPPPGDFKSVNRWKEEGGGGDGHERRGGWRGGREGRQGGREGRRELP